MMARLGQDRSAVWGQESFHCSGVGADLRVRESGTHVIGMVMVSEVNVVLAYAAKCKMVLYILCILERIMHWCVL
jgi:hypothetical protein